MTRRRSTSPSLGDTLDLFATEPAAAPRARGAKPAAGRVADAVSRTRAVPATLAPDLLVPSGAGGALSTLDDLVDDVSVGGIPGASPRSAVTVSTLTLTAKDVVEGAFMPLWVRGEVSDFKAHRNGHWYFSLRDGTAQVRCVIWARDAQRLPAAPDDGMAVAALGQPTVYAARGDLQLVVRAIEAKGDGLWRKALERTRARLDADGLFDTARKRPLPRFPRRIAVITSPDGAALHDVVAVARRRCATVEIVVVPAKVQGDGAADELCAALARVARWREVDVIIIGRGGGAREDLWAFNDEALARAVAASPVPVVCAVGHEVDITICDLVADLRAATPSVAAESVVPVLDELADEVRAHARSLSSAALRYASRARDALTSLRDDLGDSAERAVERRRSSVERVAGRLHALSPLATLARGYAVARSADGRTLSRASQFAPGADFRLIVADGEVAATVREPLGTPHSPASA